MPKAKPSQFLISAKKGILINHGQAASRTFLAGTVWQKIPAEQLETTFCMTQETKDGIPLRFKGSVTYRILRPELIAQRFDFTEPAKGLGKLSLPLMETALAELRDAVSHMTMDQCIEGRKTVLSVTIKSALDSLVSGTGDDWGVGIDSVQVAQVYIVDDNLRQELETGTRSSIASESNLAKMKSEETVKLANLEGERVLKREELTSQKEFLEREQTIFRIEKDGEKEKTLRTSENRMVELEADATIKSVLVAQERIRALETQENKKTEILMEQELQRMRFRAEDERLELELPVQKKELEHRLSLAQSRLDLARIEHEIHLLTARDSLLEEQARHEMRLQALPFENLPAVAQAAGSMFRKSHLSLYQGNSNVLSAVEPLLNLMGQAFRPESKGK